MAGASSTSDVDDLKSQIAELREDLGRCMAEREAARANFLSARDERDRATSAHTRIIEVLKQTQDERDKLNRELMQLRMDVGNIALAMNEILLKLGGG